MTIAQITLKRLIARMFQGMSTDARNVGSEMASHMPTLYALARHAVGPIVELGTGRGWSTVALVAGALDSTGRVAVKSYDINPECERLAWNAMGIEGNAAMGGVVKQIWQFSSKPNLEGVKEWADESVGLCFLDTSHRYEDTVLELEAWRTKIHPEGIICGHDYFLHESPGWTTQSGVKRAVDEFVQKHGGRFTFRVHKCDQGLFIFSPKE